MSEPALVSDTPRTSDEVKRTCGMEWFTIAREMVLFAQRLERELALAKHNLAEMHKAAAGLRSLLEEHQELSRIQGNRIDALERELGETQARLRGAQNDNQRLNTMLNGYERRTRA